MGFGNKKSVPEWVRNVPQGDFQAGIRRRLPFWMNTHEQAWRTICGALVAAPLEWVYADELEKSDASLAARVRLKLDELLQEIKPSDMIWAWAVKEVLPWDRTFNVAAVRPWREEQLNQFLADCRNPLSLPLPKDIEFHLAPTDQEWPEKPWALPIRTYEGSLAKIRFRVLVDHGTNSESRFTGSKTVVADPTDPGEMTYWAAVAQTVTGTELVVLKTTGEIELGYGGPVTLWAWGTEVDVELPVPASRIDPTWDQLPRIITHCQQSGLLYQAHREQDGLRTAFK